MCHATCGDHLTFPDFIILIVGRGTILRDLLQGYVSTYAVGPSVVKHVTVLRNRRISSLTAVIFNKQIGVARGIPPRRERSLRNENSY